MFCKNCGNEILEDVLFCPNCGAKMTNEPEKEEIKTKKGNGCLKFLIIFIGIIVFLIFIIGISDTDTNQPQNSSNEKSCPSVAEMEDAINQYQNGEIITSFNPKLNSVYISRTAQNVFKYDDYEVLGYLTACYSAHVKGNNLVWVEIYDDKTHKKLAKYSQSYGFKLYD